MNNNDLSPESRHLLIDALVKELPLPGAVWSLKEQAKWMAAMKAALDLLYPEERGDEG